MKLTRTQLITLRTISRAGGTMNGYAGQGAFYVLSLDKLGRLGLIERLGTCACFAKEPCDRTHKPGLIYNVVRITDAGKQVLSSTG